MKKCVTSIFTVIALLLLNVTNVSAYGNRSNFNLNYIKGAPTSQTVSTLTLVSQNSQEVIVNVSQLTQGAQLSVSSSGLNPKQTIIDKVGTYHIPLSQITTAPSVTITIRLIPNENLPAATASGSIGYPD